MRLRNLTPHSVTIHTDTGSVDCPPEPGIRPRLDEAPKATEPVVIDGLSVPTVRVCAGPVIGLPEPVFGTLLLVSRVIAAASPGRTDLVVPYDLVRDETGRVLACRSLARITTDPRS